MNPSDETATKSMQRPNPHSNRPEGLITRGKTAPNRLRRVDNFVASYDAPLITRKDGLFRHAQLVDLGYGSDPTTALECAERLRRLNPDLPLLGVEIKPERVRRGQPFCDDLTHFRLGGFNLPLQQNSNGDRETVRLVRAFNVLRQYDEAEALPAIDQVMNQILPEGLFVEGTSDPYGRVWTANLIRRTPEGADQPWVLEGLVLGANLNVDFDPEAFQTRLPKLFIHRMTEGEPIFAFMENFKAAARDTRSSEVWGPRAWFTAAGSALIARGYDISRPDRWLRQGWLVWRNPDLPVTPSPAG